MEFTELWQMHLCWHPQSVPNLVTLQKRLGTKQRCAHYILVTSLNFYKVISLVCTISQHLLDKYLSNFSKRLSTQQRCAYYILVMFHWVFTWSLHVLCNLFSILFLFYWRTDFIVHISDKNLFLDKDPLRVWSQLALVFVCSITL